MTAGSVSPAAGRACGADLCSPGSAARVALRCPAGDHGPRAEAPEGSARAKVGGPGRRPAGRDPGRSRPLAPVGRRPSQGPGTPVRAGRPARRAKAGAASDARERPAVAAPRPVAAPRRPRDDPVPSIVTEAPDAIWAVDGTQLAPLRDGKVWLFAVAEHRNAGALGWHVSRRGKPLAGRLAGRCAGSTAISAATRPAVCDCATIPAAASWPRTSRTGSRPGA